MSFIGPASSEAAEFAIDDHRSPLCWTTTASPLYAIIAVVGLVLAGGCGGSDTGIVAPENPQPLAGPDLDRDGDSAVKTFDE